MEHKGKPSRAGRNAALVGLAFQIGPVFGLLGTIIGMIRAFSTMGEGGVGGSEALAGDIGFALITTAIGLIMALVGIVLIVIAITALKYRPAWLFWVLLPFLCRILLVRFPVGLLIGGAALTLLIIFRKSFLDQQCVPDLNEQTKGETPMQQKQTAGEATASLVLGILSLIMFGILTAIPAVICGHIAKSKIKKDPDNLMGEGQALAGLIMGYITIGLSILVTIAILAAVAIPLMYGNPTYTPTEYSVHEPLQPSEL